MTDCICVINQKMSLSINELKGYMHCAPAVQHQTIHKHVSHITVYVVYSILSYAQWLAECTNCLDKYMEFILITTDYVD